MENMTTKVKRRKSPADYHKVTISLGASGSLMADDRHKTLKVLAQAMGCNTLSEMFQAIADYDIELKRTRRRPR